jgi:hypothetical protein
LKGGEENCDEIGGGVVLFMHKNTTKVLVYGPYKVTGYEIH